MNLSSHITMSIVTVFQIFWKNLIFSKICDIYEFLWLFSALQFRKCPKGVYRMTTGQVLGKILYPILPIEPKNFNGLLVFADHHFCVKVFD